MAARIAKKRLAAFIQDVRLTLEIDISQTDGEADQIEVSRTWAKRTIERCKNWERALLDVTVRVDHGEG